MHHSVVRTDYFTVGDNVQIGDITKILLRTYWIEVFPAWELVSVSVAYKQFGLFRYGLNNYHYY